MAHLDPKWCTVHEVPTYSGEAEAQIPICVCLRLWPCPSPSCLSCCQHQHHQSLCLGCLSFYQSVRAHIRAHIHAHVRAHISRISLRVSFGRELSLSQPLRWSCSLSSLLFSCVSMKWSAFPSNSVVDIRNRSGSHVSLESLEGPASLLLPILRPVAPLIWLSHLL